MSDTDTNTNQDTSNQTNAENGETTAAPKAPANKRGAKAPAELPPGVVRVMHEEGVGASWGGNNYEPDKDGSIVVPHAAVADLASHGFEPV